MKSLKKTKARSMMWVSFAIEGIKQDGEKVNKL
jgi:hypothetical protein